MAGYVRALLLALGFTYKSSIKQKVRRFIFEVLERKNPGILFYISQIVSLKIVMKRNRELLLCNIQSYIVMYTTSLLTSYIHNATPIPDRFRIKNGAQHSSKPAAALLVAYAI